jgi:hypothetical protein
VFEPSPAVRHFVSLSWARHPGVERAFSDLQRELNQDSGVFSSAFGSFAVRKMSDARFRLTDRLQGGRHEVASGCYPQPISEEE